MPDPTEIPTETPTERGSGGETSTSAQSSALQSVTALLGNDFARRVVSGAIVGAVALAMAYWGPIPFALLTFAIAAIMSWEWSRIVRGNGFDVPAIVHFIAVFAVAVLAGLGMAGLAIAAAVTGSIIVAALVFGGPHAPLSGLGVLYTGLPVVALGWLREDMGLGFLAAMFILLAVAITDTGAYFAGRSLGGPKLMPSVSPNKTWSGLIGGVCAAGLAGLVFPFLTGSGSSLWLGTLGVILALVAQAGDLAESALKRHFNLKDASDLIPGHGGFMDRMDGIVTASLAAALIAFAIDAYAPARALLYGS